jgi:hypothetical protein
MTSSSAFMSGVLVKIDRAKAHLNDFDRRAGRIQAACRESIVRERDEQRSEYVFRFDRVPIVPTVLSAIIGDAIHNLRVSLDIWPGNWSSRTAGRPANPRPSRSMKFRQRRIATAIPVSRSAPVSRRNWGKSSMRCSRTSERSQRTTYLPSSTGSTSATSIGNCSSPLSASRASVGSVKLNRPHSTPVPMTMARKYVGSPTPARMPRTSSIPLWDSRYASMNQRPDRGA